MNWPRSTLLYMKSKVCIKYFVHDCSICIGFWRWSYKIISAATSTLRIVNVLKINFTFFLKLLLSQSKYLKFSKQISQPAITCSKLAIEIGVVLVSLFLTLNIFLILF